MIRRLSILFLASTLTTLAHAQIVVSQRIGVDISSTNGTATNWTSITSFGTGIAALDLSNGATISGVTVGFATSGTSASGGFNDLGGYAASNLISSAPSSVTTDGAYGTATSGANALTLTFGGLDNSLTYTLEVFSVAGGLPAFNDPDTPLINGVATTWATGFTTRAARYQQMTGATFTGLHTDGAGNLSFAISDAVHSNAIMNGAILTATASAVPEPSTYAALAGLAALGLVALRRRRTAR